jgi:hypothetical protein
VGSHRAPSMPVWVLICALSMREQERTDLQTFKDVGTVVKARARWVEVERSIRFNLRRGPSAVWRKVHIEHMVCRDLSKLSGGVEMENPRHSRTSPNTRVSGSGNILSTAARVIVRRDG